MGYSDLIDKLLDTRINEGMLSTLGDKGIKSLLKALDKGDAKQLKGSNIRIDTHYFNNSPFSRDLLPYVVSGEELPSIRGKDYNIYHLSCKGEDYIVVFEYANQIDENNLSRCVVHLCDSKDVVSNIWGYVSRGKLLLSRANDTFSGCKIVADTYRVRKSTQLLSSSYKSEAILNNDLEVFCAMFDNSVGFIKSGLRSDYKIFISMLEDTCIDYFVGLKSSTLTINFSFKTKEDCMKICNYINGKNFGSSDFFGLTYYGYNDFSLEFFF